MSEEINEKKDEKEVSKTHDVPPLSKLEFCICLTIWFIYVFAGCWKMYKLSYNKKTAKYFLGQGWLEKSYFGLYKDTTEYLWNKMRILFATGWSSFALYLLISKILRSKTSAENFMIGCTAFAILLTYLNSSWAFVGMEFGLFLLMVIAGLLRCKILVWILGLVMLYGFRYWTSYSFFQMNHVFKSSYPYTALLITRGISVGLTVADSSAYNMKLFLEMMFYFWYFPAIIGSRMMTIRDFIAQIYKPFVIEDWKNFFYHVYSVLFYFVIWDLVTRLVHVHLVFETHDLNAIHSFYLFGAQMFQGIHYYMAYLVMYKTVYLITKLDGFLTAEGPECISHIALYSRMWRNFDRGLHIWLKDHVFRPIVKLGPFNITRHFAALSSFGFVVLFHGLEKNNLLWISLNILQYYLEHFFKYAYNDTWLGPFMEKNLSKRFIRQVIGILGGMSFFISIYGFCAFQFGIPIANTIFGKLLKADLNHLYHYLAPMIVFAYCHSQISITTCEYLRKRKLKIS